MSRLLASFMVMVTLALHADQKWTIDETFAMKTISDVQIGPDNKGTLFVVTEANCTSDSYTSKIYKSEEGVCEELLKTNQSCSQPRWSPDGKWIAYLVSKNGVKHLYLMSMTSKMPRCLVHGTQDVQTFAWSPDSRKIAYVMTSEKKNGESINRLFVTDIFLKMAPKALTDDEFCVRGNGDFGTSNVEFDWSKDSKSIIFAYSSSPSLEAFYLDSSIALVNVNTASITKWEKRAAFEAMPRFSPDDKQVAYLTELGKKKYNLVRQLAIRTPIGNDFKLLAATPDEGPFLAGPNFLGWSAKGDSLIFYEPNATKFCIVMVPSNGEESFLLDTGDLLIKEPALSLNREFLGFVGQSTDSPPEAFITRLDDFKPEKISSTNDHFQKFPQIKTQIISWRSSDGLEIEGLLTYPIDYQEDKKYPLLVIVHGGPMAFFDESFLGAPGYYPYATFAQEGYFILKANPRGSCGYGKAFRGMNYQDWGGMDFVDIMSGVDALVAKDIVDAEKMGIMGWSYGGYMTAWTITQCAKFKAASMGAGLSNLVSMNETTDLHHFLTDYMGAIEENFELYVSRSPLTHVANVMTPCLIQHGTTDLRVPVSQGQEFYDALTQNGKVASLTLYPEMAHRFTKPKMYYQAMLENLEWFNRYLK